MGEIADDPHEGVPLPYLGEDSFVLLEGHVVNQLLQQRNIPVEELPTVVDALLDVIVEFNLGEESLEGLQSNDELLFVELEFELEGDFGVVVLLDEAEGQFE